MAIKQDLKAYIIPVSSIDEEIRNNQNCISFPINLPIGLEYVLLLALDTYTEFYIENNIEPICIIDLRAVQFFDQDCVYNAGLVIKEMTYIYSGTNIEEDLESAIWLLPYKTSRIINSQTNLVELVINPFFDIVEKHANVVFGMINNKLLNDVSDFTDASELLK